LAEGWYPNIFISARVAAAINQKARHIRYRGLNHQYYRDLIIELIREHGPVPREEINRLLLDKLPEGLTSDQKAMMIHNFLSALRMKGAIKNVGSRRFPKWVMA
jgi:ATP-dependent DNA helicase RecG